MTKTTINVNNEQLTLRTPCDSNVTSLHGIMVNYHLTIDWLLKVDIGENKCVKKHACYLATALFEILETYIVGRLSLLNLLVVKFNWLKGAEHKLFLIISI